MATFKVNTKSDKDAAAVQTALTVDFTGCTPEVLQEIATSAIVIKWQGQARKNGIPESATIRAVDYRPGNRVTSAPSIDQLVTKMTPEEKQKLLAQLMEEQGLEFPTDAE